MQDSGARSSCGESLKMVVGERGYDLPKRPMFGNDSGSIFGSSHFSKDGRQLHCGVRFEGTDVGCGVGLSHVDEPKGSG